MSEPLPMYDRNLFGRPPGGAAGDINLQTGEGHHTQHYGGHRYSWDTDFNQGQVTKEHWTNQQVGRKDPGRHDPPSWAR